MMAEGDAMVTKKRVMVLIDHTAPAQEAAAAVAQAKPRGSPIPSARSARPAGMSDGIHLSTEGSKVIFDEIMEVLIDTKFDLPLHLELLQYEFAEERPYDFIASYFE